MSSSSKKILSYITAQALSILGILILAFIIRTFGYGLYQVPTGSMETTMLVGERFFADKLTVQFKGLKRGEIVSFNDPKYNYSKNYFKNLWEHYVHGPSNWTKRVIGTPGDSVKGQIIDGKPVVFLKKKGEDKFNKLDEPYLNKFPLIAVAEPNQGRFLVYKSYDPKVAYDKQKFYKLKSEDVMLGSQRAKYYVGDSAVRHPGTPLIEGGKKVDEFNVVLGDTEYWVMGDNRLGSSDSRYWGVLDRKFVHGKIVYRIWSLDSNSSWWIKDLVTHPIKFWSKIRWNRCMQSVN